MRNSLSSFSLSLLLISAAPLAAADAADTAGHGFFESQSARDAALLESRVSHGTAAEAKSPMRQPASADALAALLREAPAQGYFCFTEDRARDIRSPDILPAHWAARPAAARSRFAGKCAPGEFYTWQIALYAPLGEAEDVRLVFSDLQGATGKIPASALRCFNLGGVNFQGKTFTKKIDVQKGKVGAFWIGADVAENIPAGTYTGKIKVVPKNLPPTDIDITLTVAGAPLPDHGDNDGFRKTRLRWLDSRAGETTQPTAPYTPLRADGKTISFLGGVVALAPSGLPAQITTRYSMDGRLNAATANKIFNSEVRFIVETADGEETLKGNGLRFTRRDAEEVAWESRRENKNFLVVCAGRMQFDGFAEYKIAVTAKNNIAVKDIRLEVPYAEGASKYFMGLGKRGGLAKNLAFNWKWDTKKHQDKVWFGDVNAGWNIKFKDENYVRPLINIYYSFGKIKEPTSWSNSGKGGVRVSRETDRSALVTAFGGTRNMSKGETLNFDIETLITPVKPIDRGLMARERFYHAGGERSGWTIGVAKGVGANYINVHHAKEVYPYINYPYSDESASDLRDYIKKANQRDIGVRVYYTTRELTVKVPELWALRSLGSEVLFDGPGKDTKTLIHSKPAKWLCDFLGNHFIPAWYATLGGIYKGQTDISIITTPDSRWNNFYLAGLDWMVKKLGIAGVYVDDSALERTTLRRARTILDADGKRRSIDMHSWSHLNGYAGYASSLQIYMDLLPYVDRLWLGEGFGAANNPDFWLVEMSGIPFGLPAETLDARNLFRGMVYGMLPRAPWSGNPTPMWQILDSFGIQNAQTRGYWDARCPVKTGNPELYATVYINGDKALVALANWTAKPQAGTLKIDAALLGFKPSRATLPEIKSVQAPQRAPEQNSQKAGAFVLDGEFNVGANGGYIILLEK